MIYKGLLLGSFIRDFDPYGPDLTYEQRISLIKAREEL
jgi:hypothetical protein